jgi:hypothetical protein
MLADGFAFSSSPRRVILLEAGSRMMTPASLHEIDALIFYKKGLTVKMSREYKS